MSDDGAHGLALIAFVGSVFSPYYAWARRHAGAQGADPSNHCAVNVALYGAGGSRWAMTERGRGALQRDARNLRVGKSALHWTGAGLHIDLDEITVPWPTRLRGHVEVTTENVFDSPIQIAPGHHWCPIAPAARVQVDLGGMRWSGDAYLDANHGEGPLESAFARWNWSRARLANGDGLVFYDIERRDATALQLALRLRASDGSIEPVDPPPVVAVGSTAWRIARHARADAGTQVRVLRTLTDAPFYARSLLSTHCIGERVTAMHESLDLARFDSRWVQAMLAFRMPRRA